ncbi:type II toxin-antitoxin system VapC family toxin [Gluconobacter thailandicus]|uniref:Type II toxin-antitoxin system VapC family toxin n=1 Tax=Gluconobacter thailandicus TaxID=257438 RepID=A0AAP9JI23_GLUTH|nr:type II toxin-antitoxin system VapC family toxin [Gluconobacter thailandicus]QEH96828.1 type II toxin-antitoxin system VapC family toxin [Gluconobacter thailandicus]
MPSRQPSIDTPKAEITCQAYQSIVLRSFQLEAETLFYLPSPSWQLGVGVMRIERRDPAQESVLQNWLENYVLPEFSNRILPVDLAVGRRCAHLNVSDQCPERDTLIAATGLVHGMTVVTQNTEDFRYSGVTVLGP